MKVRADYFKWITNVDTDRLSVGADMRWALRKLTLSLHSNYSLSRTNGTSSDTKNVGIQITRYF